MKKTLAILMVVALAATAVFAEGPLSFSFQTTAAYRNNTTKVGDADAETNSGIGWVGNGNGYNAWGSDPNFAVLSYNAEKGGVSVDIRQKGLSSGNNFFLYGYNGWIKPVDMLKITAGVNIDFNVFGAETIRYNCLGFRGGEETGVKIELTPVENLYIGAWSSLLPIVDMEGKDIIPFPGAGKNLAAAVSYAIDGIGIPAFQYTFRYRGLDLGSDSGALDVHAIQAGFTLTAIENLSVKAVGSYVMFNDTRDVDDSVKKQNPLENMIKAELFADYTMDALTLKFLERAFIRTAKGYDNFGNVIKAEIAYAINDTIGVDLKLAHGLNADANNSWDGGIGEAMADHAKNSALATAADSVYKAGARNEFLACLAVPINFGNGVSFVPGFEFSLVTDTAPKTGIEKKTTKINIPLSFRYSF